MSDKIVTHADREAVDFLTSLIGPITTEPVKVRAAADLLLRLHGAVEADAPPLPEGWVLTTQHGAQQVQWHRGDGSIFPRNDLNADGISAYGGRTTVDSYDSVTPLRPTVTEAEFEAAVAAHASNRYATARECIRAAFKAAGIEVQS